MSAPFPDPTTALPPASPIDGTTDGTTGPADEPAPDRIGRYRVVGEVARGGMGVVYRAVDDGLGREVAVKVLAGRLTGRAEAAVRFTDEARITGQLQHPSVPPVFESGELPDGRPYLAMKLIKGQTLADLLKEPADPGRLLAHFEDVCQAVAYAHAHKVLHRDLKPANVMVGNFGEVQVMDWGLAKVLTGEPAAPAEPTAAPGGTEIRSLRDSGGSVTQAGSVFGTPAYMPPEQAAGAVHLIDERADVFGLGAILCVVLTGQPPYTGGDAETVRLKAIRGKLAEAFERLDGCGADPDLIALAKRCLASERDDRPRDAGEVARAVAGLRAAAEDRARRAELDRVRADGDRRAAELKAAEARKRHRVQLALAGVVLLAAVGAAAAGLWYERQRAAEEADRAARRARTASGVSAALEDARGRVSEGWGQIDEPKRMKDTAARAEDAVRRAEGLVETGEPDDATRAEVAVVRATVDDLARHARLLAEADRIMWQHADGFDDNRDRDHFRRSVREMMAALRAFGIDPTGPPEEVGPAVAASRVRGRLLGCLHEVQWWSPDDPADRERVAAVLRAAKRAAGGVLARWQTAVDGKDPDGLATVAAAPDVLDMGPDLINALGRDLRAARRPGPLLDLLRRSADRYPDSPWVHFDIAQACSEATPPLLPEALRHAAASAALVPNSPLFQVNLGDVYSKNRVYDRAAECYRKAVGLAPRNMSYRIGLANVQWQQGDLDGVEATCRAAVEIEPDNYQPHYWLGSLQVRRGDPAGAAVDLRKAAERFDPTRYSVTACLNLANALDRQRLHAEVHSLLSRVIDQRPDWAADPGRALRSMAARSAVAVAGRADTPPDERARLRRQARDWLAADLAAWTNRAAADPRSRDRLLAAMRSWLTHPNLAPVRQPSAGGQLPPDERAAWQALWAEVRGLRDRYTPETAPPPRPARR